VDLSTPGAGIATMTQSLAKRLAFEEFRPGWAKIRQTGYALGSERDLAKPQIAALWLDTVEMGRGADGWTTGFFEAAAVRGAEPADLDAPEFHRLLAVLIAPGRLTRADGSADLEERAARIARLLAGGCMPDGRGDVRLEGCA
jgi:membrane peptidoglycan carboxypeptidase